MATAAWPSTSELERLIALHEEVVALVRVGIPLDQGLKEFGAELPGQLGTLAVSLGQQLQTGQDPQVVLASPHLGLPAAYQAVVAAGIKSGRLVTAVEGVAHHLQTWLELRRSLRASLIYPCLVILLAYGMFLWAVSWLGPLWRETALEFGMEPSVSIRAVAFLGETVVWWGWIPGVAAFFGWLGVNSRMASARRDSSPSRWNPFARFRWCGELAMFADLLGLLIEQEVRLPEAVRLAGEASGNQRLSQESQALAEQIERGTTPGPGGVLPPLLVWLLASSRDGSHLVQCLRQYARYYRAEASSLSRWLTRTFPVLLTVGLGGTVTGVYAVMVLGPWFQILLFLTQP